MELLINTLNINEALQWLEHGDIAAAARKANLEKSIAYKHLKGIVKRPNVQFINAILDKAINNKRLLIAKRNSLQKMQLI